MPDRLSHYELLERLGTGGMGTVWRARDTRDGRIVAVKVLHAHLATDREYVQRFEREARITAAIDSPNIVRVFDFGQDGDAFFLVMEYLEGRTLAELIRTQGKLPVAQATAIARGIVSALADAHKRGVIHRDVKPQNVMIAADGTVKVADFGIARAIGQTAMTATGLFLGTPSYMAPETVSAATIDTRADIYAVGIVLYEMLTGAVPFTAETPWAVIGLHERATPPSLNGMRREVPGWLASVYERCLAKRPQDRFQTPASLLAALEQAEQGVAVAGTDGRRRIQWPRLAVAAVAALAIIGGVLAFALFSSPKDDDDLLVLPIESPASVVPATPTVAGGDVAQGDLLAAISDLFVEVPGPLASDYKLHASVELARGCAELADTALMRLGDRFVVKITVTGTGECTADFTPFPVEIDLGSDIEPGVEYAVEVNGTTIWFDGVQVDPTATPTVGVTATPTPQPDRFDCSAIAGTPYHSPAERDWYLDNCTTEPPSPTPIPQRLVGSTPTPVATLGSGTSPVVTAPGDVTISCNLEVLEEGDLLRCDGSATGSPALTWTLTGSSRETTGPFYQSYVDRTGALTLKLTACNAAGCASATKTIRVASRYCSGPQC